MTGVQTCALPIWQPQTAVGFAAQSRFRCVDRAFRVPPFGNLNVCGSRERKFQVFKTISFVIVWIYGFGCIALFGLLTPFVELWYGTNMQISTFAVFLLCMNLYIAGQMTTLNMQIEAGGLYWHVKFLGIVEAVSNLFFSDRKSTRLNSSHTDSSRMPSSA